MERIAINVASKIITNYVLILDTSLIYCIDLERKLSFNFM